MLSNFSSSVFTQETFRLPMLPQSQLVPMFHISFTSKGIVEIIDNISSYCAAMKMVYVTCILKPCKLFRLRRFCSSVRAKFRHCLCTGTVPADGNSASVLPIFKSGITSLSFLNKHFSLSTSGIISDPSNYRPISLTREHAQ